MRTTRGEWSLLCWRRIEDIYACTACWLQVVSLVTKGAKLPDAGPRCHARQAAPSADDVARARQDAERYLLRRTDFTFAPPSLPDIAESQKHCATCTCDVTKR